MTLDDKFTSIRKGLLEFAQRMHVRLPEWLDPFTTQRSQVRSAT